MSSYREILRPLCLYERSAQWWFPPTHSIPHQRNITRKDFLSIWNKTLKLKENSHTSSFFSSFALKYRKILRKQRQITSQQIILNLCQISTLSSFFWWEEMIRNVTEFKRNANPIVICRHNILKEWCQEQSTMFISFFCLIRPHVNLKC